MLSAAALWWMASWASPSLQQADESTAPQWPQYRGPRADGVCLETGWSSVGAEDPLWTFEVGNGHAGLSLADGQLFTTGQQQDVEEDSLWCLDTVTGEVRWKLSYRMPLGRDHGDGTLSTPTLDDRHVYLFSRNGNLRCVDRRSGEEKWLQKLAKLHLVRPGRYGFSASPVLLDDLVIQCAGRISALRREDGEVVWTTEDLGAQYSTPVVLRDGEQRWLVVFTQEGLVLLDLDTREVAGGYPWNKAPNHVNAAMPVLHEDSIFLSSAYDHGCVLLRRDGTTLTPRFESRVMRNKMSGCVLWEDHLYGFDESILKCIDLDGKERWRERGLGCGSLLVSDGRLLVLSSSGEFLVATASPDGFTELSRRDLFDEGVCWTAPVLHGGRVYCRNSLGTLICLDHRPPGARGETSGLATGPATVPEADALFRRHLEAVGGEAAVTGARSLSFTGTLTHKVSSPEPVAWHLHRMAPDRWYWKVILTKPVAGTVERVFDGSVGWEINPFQANSLLAAERLRELRETAALHAAARFEELYPTRTTRGPRRFGGADCYLVEARSTGGALRKLYFDRVSGLLRGHTADQESIVVYDRYRDFEGRKIATAITEFEPDTGIETLYEVHEVEVDSVDPARFERGPAVQELLEDQGSGR